MNHPTHVLKAYTGDVNRRMTFCVKCGKEEDEGLDQPCTEKFYVKSVDTPKERK